MIYSVNEAKYWFLLVLKFTVGTVEENLPIRNKGILRHFCNYGVQYCESKLNNYNVVLE